MIQLNMFEVKLFLRKKRLKVKGQSIGNYQVNVQSSKANSKARLNHKHKYVHRQHQVKHYKKKKKYSHNFKLIVIIK